MVPELNPAWNLGMMVRFKTNASSIHVNYRLLKDRLAQLKQYEFAINKYEGEVALNQQDNPPVPN